MKIFLLGTAALMVATGAQAADPILMDVKAPREPVYRCDITGFIELPGTDICFKVGGYAKLITTVASDDWPAGDDGTTAAEILPNPNAALYFDDGELEAIEYFGSGADNFRMASVGRINFDARTVTEYGTLRAYVEMQAVDGNSSSSGSFGMRHAYVQFGNWTFGKTYSTFHDGDALPNVAYAFTTVGDNTFRTDQIRYTQSFGNGFSVSLAIEDPRNGRADPIAFAGGEFLADGVYMAPFFPAIENDLVVNERSRIPDFVAAVQTEGDWGHARLAGAIVHNDLVAARDFTDGGLVITRTVDADDDIGWGLNFGLVLNAPMFGPDDVFTFQTTYTDGASKFQGNTGAVASLVYGGPDCVLDGVDFDGCGISDSVEVLSVVAGYQHFWTPTVNTSIGGGYARVDYGRGVGLVAYDADDGTFATGSVETEVWDAFANVEWNPVPRLSFLLEARYGHFDAGYDLFVEDGEQDYAFGGDNDAWAVALDITRSF